MIFETPVNPKERVELWPIRHLRLSSLPGPTERQIHLGRQAAARCLEGGRIRQADTIAQGLSAFAQKRVAFQAGRIMRKRLVELAAARASFGYETTLASRSYAAWLARLRDMGYKVHIVFLVAAECRRGGGPRCRAGSHRRARCARGHDPPAYDAGLKNLLTPLYAAGRYMAVA